MAASDGHTASVSEARSRHGQLTRNGLAAVLRELAGLKR
jgi:hypothetical protein